MTLHTLYKVLVKKEQANYRAGFDTYRGSRDIHFEPMYRLCHPCQFPAKYILRQETFSQDYQFMMKDVGLWDRLNDKAKSAALTVNNAGSVVNVTEMLSELSLKTRKYLLWLRKEDLNMFGYTYDPVLNLIDILES